MECTIEKKREILRIVDEEILTDKSRWAQGAYARRLDGTHTDPGSATAVCWCFAGAVDRAIKLCMKRDPTYERCYRPVMDDSAIIGLTIGYNDSLLTTFESVKKRIAIVRKRLAAGS